MNRKEGNKLNPLHTQFSCSMYPDSFKHLISRLPQCKGGLKGIPYLMMGPKRKHSIQKQISHIFTTKGAICISLESLLQLSLACSQQFGLDDQRQVFSTPAQELLNRMGKGKLVCMPTPVAQLSLQCKTKTSLSIFNQKSYILPLLKSYQMQRRNENSQDLDPNKKQWNQEKCALPTTPLTP